MTITWTDEVYAYVACVYGDGTDPGDCYTRVGYSWRIDPDALDGEQDYGSEAEATAAVAASVRRVWWYDDGDDERTGFYGPYDDEEEARMDAEAHAAEAHEGEPGEDADDVRRRTLEERAGEPDPNGEWCVWWETAGDDPHVVERYASAEAAEASADLKNEALHRQHPGGRLLCGHTVRHLVGGEWVDISD